MAEPNGSESLQSQLDVANSMIDSDPNPVLSMDLAGRLVYANPAGVDLAKSWGIEIGSAMPSALVVNAIPNQVVTLEIPVGARTYSFCIVSMPECGRIHVYATDVTTTVSIAKFPEENPNPILRLNTEGSVIYANSAAQSIMEAWGIEIGSLVPDELIRHAQNPTESQLNMNCGPLTFSFRVVPVPELDFINVYGTDVTAMKTLTEFPDQNPNPVLRTDMGGTLLYANPAAAYVLQVWDIDIGGQIPDGIVKSSGHEMVDELEIEVGARTYIFNMATVPAFKFINIYGTDISAARDNEKILAKLAKYFSPQVYKSIFSGDLEVEIQTKRKRLTVFFSDIQGFSQVTEQLEPEALTELITEYLTVMTDIAFKYGGTVDKYIGDAIMVFFGDPESAGIKEDALACIRMAIEMKASMYAIQNMWKSRGISQPLDIRIGIHTDICTVGNFGSNDRLDYTTIGNGVNIASRLESSAKPNQILISEDTYLLIKDEIDCIDLDPIRLKNMTHPIQVYEVRNDQEMNATIMEIDETQDGFSLFIDPRTIKNVDKKREALERAIAILNRMS